MFVLIIGLPGSGKSYYLNTIDSKYKFDDGFSLTNKEYRNHRNKVIHVSDARFCNIEKLKLFLKTYQVKINEVSIVLFENDKKKCIQNIQSRINQNPFIFEIQRFIFDIDRFSKTYKMQNYKIFDITRKDVYSVTQRNI